MHKRYEQLRKNRYLNLGMINLRFLIGFGFLPSGFKKIINEPFTNLENTGPFFDYLDALYYTGAYYNMIGWAQVLAATLLITQRFATLGAFIFLPIIFNIAALTLSTIGSFTPLIAVLMLLGIVLLLLWDYPKWINIFSADNKSFLVNTPKAYPVYSLWGWAGAGIFFLTLLGALLHIFAPGSPQFQFPILIAILLLPLLAFGIDEAMYRRAGKQVSVQG